MATKHIPPETVPLPLTPLRTILLPAEKTHEILTNFLTSQQTSQNLSSDVIYQLTQLNRNLQWQADGKLEERGVLQPGEEFAGDGDTVVAKGKEVSGEDGKKKKKKKGKGGSKWAA